MISKMRMVLILSILCACSFGCNRSKKIISPLSIPERYKQYSQPKTFVAQARRPDDPSPVDFHLKDGFGLKASLTLEKSQSVTAGDTFVLRFAFIPMRAVWHEVTVNVTEGLKEIDSSVDAQKILVPSGEITEIFVSLKAIAASGTVQVTARELDVDSPQMGVAFWRFGAADNRPTSKTIRVDSRTLAPPGD